MERKPPYKKVVNIRGGGSINQWKGCLYAWVIKYLPQLLYLVTENKSSPKSEFSFLKCQSCTKIFTDWNRWFLRSLLDQHILWPIARVGKLSVKYQIENILGFAGHITGPSYILCLFLQTFQNVKIILSLWAVQKQAIVCRPLIYSQVYKFIPRQPVCFHTWLRKGSFHLLWESKTTLL